MNNKKNIIKEDKLDSISLIIGIATLPIIMLGLLRDVILFPVAVAPIIGFVFGFVSKNKNKKRTIGIILNSITFVLMFILFIVVMIAFSMDSM